MPSRGPDHIQPPLTDEIKASMDRAIPKFEEAFSKISNLDLAYDVNTIYAWATDEYTVGIEIDWIRVELNELYAVNAKLLLDIALKSLSGV